MEKIESEQQYKAANLKKTDNIKKFHRTYFGESGKSTKFAISIR